MQACPHVSLNSAITTSLQGRQVFKDECTKCYENQMSERGIDVCLACFNGGCKSEVFNHSSQHSSQNNHPLVLNMKKVKVEKDPNEEKQQITKLAIGKPGGIDFDEKWEQHVSVFCNSCKVIIDYSNNPTLKGLVDSIIAHHSVVEQGNIQAWEEDVLPCEHTLTIDQSGAQKVPPKYLMKCSKCDLTSNLWICLGCGNLGCGRKNFDGTGGNGHGLEHFENNKSHHLVVKSGTITPEGDASVYCYTCQNEIKDPDIAIHMANVGIDIKEQKKTEKTITEMSLDLNLNFTLSKTIEDGIVMKNLYGPGFTGLNNLGNSCYMNSVIQVLFSLESFQAKYFDNAMMHLMSCNKRPHECYLCQLSKIMYGLFSGVYSEKKIRQLPKIEGKEDEFEEYQDGISPHSFKNYFAENNKDFISNKQQDATEYLFHIMEIFEKNEKRSGLPNAKNEFTFDLETRLECLSCNTVRYSNTRTYFLSFLVPNWENYKDKDSRLNIDECIKQFITEEILQANCSQCNQKNINFRKSQKVKNYPKYFIVTLQRFIYDWNPIKLETQFEFPLHALNLEILSRNHSQQGEKVVEVNSEEVPEEEEYPINSSALNTLVANGVPEPAAKQALFNTGNSDVDAALMWFYSNIDNPNVNDPLPKVKKQVKGKEKKEVNQEHLENLKNFGYEEEQIKFALRKCNNNFEQALEMFFNSPDGIQIVEEDDNDQENTNDNKEINVGNSPRYNLYAFITHLGANTTAGHYVCHISKGNEWVYYNDARVTSCDKPPFGKGFIYFFKNEKY